MMKRSLLGALIAGMLLPSLSFAEAGDWVVRLRAATIKPNEDSSLGKYVNQNVGNGATLMSPNAELKVDSNTIPELDISYYFTKNIAAELILATGSKHDVKISGDSLATIGNQKLGEIEHLPPTLTVQWHFNPDETFDPYVGAGINATFLLDRYLRGTAGAINGSKIRIDRDSFGPALQAGIDVNLKDGWLLNADVKYLWINTDVELRNPIVAGNPWTKIDKLDVNPWVIGVGIGKRF